MRLTLYDDKGNPIEFEVVFPHPLEGPKGLPKDAVPLVWGEGSFGYGIPINKKPFGENTLDGKIPGAER